MKQDWTSVSNPLKKSSQPAKTHTASYYLQVPHCLAVVGLWPALVVDDAHVAKQVRAALALLQATRQDQQHKLGWRCNGQDVLQWLAESMSMVKVVAPPP